MNFSKFDTPYKVLAIYYLQNIINNEKNFVNINISLIETHVKLAKNHGIFGFGIVNNEMIDLKFNEEILNLFSNNKMYNFPFFIIISYNGKYKREKQNLIMQKVKNEENEISIFFGRIKEYFMSENYIKLRNKPILGIFHSPLISQLIRYFRKYEKKNKMTKFILYIFLADMKI